NLIRPLRLQIRGRVAKLPMWRRKNPVAVIVQKAFASIRPAAHKWKEADNAATQDQLGKEKRVSHDDCLKASKKENQNDGYATCRASRPFYAIGQSCKAGPCPFQCAAEDA